MKRNKNPINIENKKIYFISAIRKICFKLQTTQLKVSGDHICLSSKKIIFFRKKHDICGFTTKCDHNAWSNLVLEFHKWLFETTTCQYLF
jgi:hypothetical protein